MPEPVAAASPKVWEPAWTEHVAKAIAAHSPELLSPGAKPARDVAAFCPGFGKADKAERALFWAAVFEAIARYESNFDPAARMQESWADPETGDPQYSEGLLQLSYSDRKGHPECALDRAQGNIVDPEINLSCGVAIMRRQLAARGTLFPRPKPYYWSVLTSQKVQPKVKAYLALAAGRLPFCAHVSARR